MKLLILSSLLILTFQSAFGQSTRRGDLSISGAIEVPVTLTAPELAAMPQHIVAAHDRTGKPVKFSGVTLQSVLERAGLRFGQALRGARLTSFLLVEAADGYRVVFALPELDASFSNKMVLLATSKDGEPLSPVEGPWRIVVPDEKKQTRWVRQVTALKILRAEDALEE